MVCEEDIRRRPRYSTATNIGRPWCLNSSKFHTGHPNTPSTKNFVNWPQPAHDSRHAVSARVQQCWDIRSSSLQLSSVFFGCLGPIYTNLGYLRSVYASLRRVGGSLRGWNVKKAPTQAPTQVFDRRWRSKPLAVHPLQTCLRLRINKCLREEPTPPTLHCKTHMISLRNISYSYLCSRFHDLKKNDAQLTIVILLQEVSVSVHACTTINHLQPLTRTKLCTCGVVGRHVACTLHISQSHMSNSTTSMRHTHTKSGQSSNSWYCHQQIESTMCPYITCLSMLCAIDTYTLMCVYTIHKKLRTGSLDFELK